MKYIRTKDGIFERMFSNNEHRISFDHKNIEPAYYTINHEWVAKRDVIKEADTIEELCDEFVFTCEDCNKPQLVIPMNFDYCKKEFNHTEIYGAIWVIDRNGVPTLKPVAKMNEKGKIELL